MTMCWIFNGAGRHHLILTDLQVGPPLAHTELRLEAVPEMGYSPDDASGASGEVCRALLFHFIITDSS